MGTVFRRGWHGTGKKGDTDDSKGVARRSAPAVPGPVTRNWRQEDMVEVASAPEMSRSLDYVTAQRRP